MAKITEETSLLQAYKEGKELVKNTKKPVELSMAMSHPYGDFEKTAMEDPLIKSVVNELGNNQEITRIAFEEDPGMINEYQSIYKNKTKLLSDDVIKQVTIKDDLVASIVHTRSCHVSSCGRPQPDRFSTGYKIEPEPGLTEKLDEKQKALLLKRIAAAEAKLLTCGETSGWKDSNELNFGQFLFMTTRDAVSVGRLAVEFIWTGVGDNKKFHSFRPIDAGTIYRAAPHKEQAEAVRQEAFNLLQRIKNKKLIPEKFMNDEYAWVQVIRGQPRQAFTAEECVVHNFYPSTHVELNGYPITPLDTVFQHVITHLNIVTHNRLYFQNGRAAKGMVIVKSDDVNKKVIAQFRQQFNASINSVSNAWRMPIFGVGSQDDIVWTPIDSSSRDMEFQYLSDTNARVILSAFQMSPEELPGYTHLSRGTNNQALSESNNEYKLEAHRDVGLRPLLAHFQNFINSKILPLIDPEIAKTCSFKFVGLDADTAEKEAARIGAEINIHLTMDEILEKVEKKPIGEDLGGKMLLNTAWQGATFPFVYAGDIREKIFGVKGASKDPEWMYVRDDMWFQWQQMRMQQQQMQMQAQQPPQQGQQGQGNPGQQDNRQQLVQQDQQSKQNQPQDSELARSIDQAANLLSKGEAHLSPNKKKLIEDQVKIIGHFMDGWTKDADEAIKEIVSITKKFSKK